MKLSSDSSRSDHASLIPALRQSRQGDMACETLYVYKHVQCAKVGQSEPAARGIEIHEVLATYINHPVSTRRKTDLEVFDALMRGAGVEARDVLERFRDNHAFDPEKILATELHIALDENFLPIEQVSDDGEIAEYEGTLDLVMIHSLTEAEIDDWKSYYQVIDVDTFQSKFYPLLLMSLNPSLERVKFVLEFVRYGVSRWVEYKRKDVPWLKELAQRERTRQRKLHRLNRGRKLKTYFPRKALQLVPPSPEWLPRGRGKSLRPDDGRKTAPLCRLASGSRKAEHQGGQRSHGETRTDPLP